MDDKTVRIALKKKVIGTPRGPSTRVIDELGILHATARVDIAVVNGNLHGYEIKSNRDTLARLPHQVLTYNSVLDFVTLVAGEKHICAAERLIPAWWGLKVAQQGPRGAINFTTIRSARRNAAVQPLAIARLLWRDEVVELLEVLGAAKGWSGRPRGDLYARVADVAPLDVLQRFVRECLKTRAIWRFAQRQE